MMVHVEFSVFSCPFSVGGDWRRLARNSQIRMQSAECRKQNGEENHGAEGRKERPEEHWWASHQWHPAFGKRGAPGYRWYAVPVPRR